MDVFNLMMDWEAGSISPDDTVKLFAALVANDMAWSLQGMYGRTAKDMIDAGFINSNGEVLRLPSEEE